MIFIKETKFTQEDPLEGMWQDIINDELRNLGISCKENSTTLFMRKEGSRQSVKTCSYTHFKGKSFQINVKKQKTTTSFVIISMQMPVKHTQIIEFFRTIGCEEMTSDDEGKAFGQEVKRRLLASVA